MRWMAGSWQGSGTNERSGVLQARCARGARLWSLACLLAFSAAAGCGEAENDEAYLGSLPERVLPDGGLRLSDTEQRALGLRTEVVQLGELGAVALRFGRVQARAEDLGLVVAPAAGRLDRGSSVALGARVEEGAVLAELVPVLGAAERLSANVRGAELAGQIDALNRELDTRRAELARAEQLASSQIVSAAKLQESRAALAAARAQLEALRNARGIQTRGEAVPIALRAPLTGTVVSLDAQPGALLAAGAVVARILKAGPLWIDVEVGAAEPSGDRYSVEWAGRVLPARLLARGSLSDDGGFRRDRIELQLAPDDGAAWVSGALVQVRVGHGTATGVIVPDAALVPDAAGAAVFVERAPGRFVRREVTVAARHAGQVRVASGLQAGERVVVRGAQALRGESLRALLQEQD